MEIGKSECKDSEIDTSLHTVKAWCDMSMGRTLLLYLNMVIAIGQTALSLTRLPAIGDSFSEPRDSLSLSPV